MRYKLNLTKKYYRVAGCYQKFGVKEVNAELWMMGNNVKVTGRNSVVEIFSCHYMNSAKRLYYFIKNSGLQNCVSVY